MNIETNLQKILEYYDNLKAGVQPKLAKLMKPKKKKTLKSLSELTVPQTAKIS